jgi:hypothetical protein
VHAESAQPAARPMKNSRVGKEKSRVLRACCEKKKDVVVKFGRKDACRSVGDAFRTTPRSAGIVRRSVRWVGGLVIAARIQDRVECEEKRRGGRFMPRCDV